MVGHFFISDNMITVPISVGELIDKITILQIKKEKIKDEAKLLKIHYELEKLELIAYQFLGIKEVKLCLENLSLINNQLWDVEDKLRKKEQEQCFDDEFILLARQVYNLNDFRFDYKNKINQLIGSDIQEVKEYVNYNRGTSG